MLQIFITWLRETTDAPEILASAAHAMKHRPETQAQGVYDANADTKLVKAAYDFNLAFAAKFAAAGGGARGGEGSGGETGGVETGWALVPEQPAAFEFKRASPDSFSCAVPWLPFFEPGMKLRLPTVPGLDGGIAFSVPSGEAVRGKTLGITVPTPATGDSFLASGLLAERPSPPQQPQQPLQPQPQQPQPLQQPQPHSAPPNPNLALPPPPPNPRQPVASRVLPKVPSALVHNQLGRVGFHLESAKPNGDCYPLSAMAGKEITVQEARDPSPPTKELVRQVRERAVGLVTSPEGMGGIDAATFRAGELLPAGTQAAQAAMAPWLANGHWHGSGHHSATFMLGVAADLGRPVVVIERDGDEYLDPVRACSGCARVAMGCEPPAQQPDVPFASCAGAHLRRPHVGRSPSALVSQAQRPRDRPRLRHTALRRPARYAPLSPDQRLPRRV